MAEASATAAVTPDSLMAQEPQERAGCNPKLCDSGVLQNGLREAQDPHASRELRGDFKW